MKLHILTVGDPDNSHIQALAADYMRRIRRYVPLSKSSIKPVRIKSMSAAEIKHQESVKLKNKLTDHGPVIALHSDGESMTSEQFAHFFNTYARQSAKQITFVIGGAWGLDSAFLKRSERCLSLSKMTLPHELTLVVLLEQIYRAHSILRGEPYHK